MATQGEKLAVSLRELHKLQNGGNIVAIKSSEINRTHRERLSKNGFLKEVSRGWYIVTNPEDQQGESTPWYTSYWNFCSRYLEDKYNGKYCISPDQSLLLHVGNTLIPEQLISRSPNGPNKVIPLLHGTNIFELKSQLPSENKLDKINGVRVFTLEYSLIYIQPIMFIKNPTDVRAALMMITDASQILAPLLDGAHTRPAGRLAGSFRNIGNNRIADEIISRMRSLDHDVRETDPFEEVISITFEQQFKSPYINRIQLLWQDYRATIIKNFPECLGHHINVKEYLNEIDQIYTTDAYHSLSIERYKVSAELINLVKSGEWNPDENSDHKEFMNIMAARGYYESTQEVKSSIQKIIKGANAGAVVKKDHSIWYQKLFAPSVTSGICKPSDLAGYRNRPVFISNSRHIPMSADAVRDVMPIFFDLLSKEEYAGVRVVLGHFFFVYIHPYIDGNGRIARFLMNTMLASGNYPWTIIPVEKREEYMAVLEEASVHGNIKPFTLFLSQLVKLTLDGTPAASSV
jgi:hypothetical protein